MADNVGRAGRGWTIAGAFVAQAVIFVGIGALLGGATGTAAVSSSSAVATPRLMPLTKPIIGKPGVAFSYTLSVDGQSADGTFLGGQAVPSYTVEPGQDLTALLATAIPDKMGVTSLTVSLSEAGQDGQPAQVQTAYNDTQPMAAGKQTFSLDWAGSASELQPGTTWSIYLTASSPGTFAYNDSLIAVVTVASS